MSLKTSLESGFFNSRVSTTFPVSSGIQETRWYMFWSNWLKISQVCNWTSEQKIARFSVTLLTNVENGKGCCREIRRFGTHSAEVRYNSSHQQAYLGGVQHPISAGGVEWLPVSCAVAEATELGSPFYPLSSSPGAACDWVKHRWKKLIDSKKLINQKIGFWCTLNDL